MVQAMPIAGPFTTATIGLGKSIKDPTKLLINDLMGLNKKTRVNLRIIKCKNLLKCGNLL